MYLRPLFCIYLFQTRKQTFLGQICTSIKTLWEFFNKFLYSQFLQLLELGKRVLFNFCDWIVVQMSEIINGLIFSVVKLLSLLYIQLTISFLIGRKRIVNFRNQRLGRHLAADYTIIMSRTLKVLDFSGSSLQVHAFCVACWFVYFYTFRNKLSVPLTIVTNFFSLSV